MANFDELHKMAEESASESNGESKYPGFTKVLPGTSRLFKILDIRPNEMTNAKPGDILWDVCDLVDNKPFTLNTPTVLEKRLRETVDGEPKFNKGDYLYVECPKDKKKSKSGKDYWDFRVVKPTEQQALNALKEIKKKR
jgi:hypothetical protein